MAFKKITEVEEIQQPQGQTTMLVEENGEIKRMAATSNWDMAFDHELTEEDKEKAVIIKEVVDGKPIFSTNDYVSHFYSYFAKPTTSKYNFYTLCMLFVEDNTYALNTSGDRQTMLYRYLDHYFKDQDVGYYALCSGHFIPQLNEEEATQNPKLAELFSIECLKFERDVGVSAISHYWDDQQQDFVEVSLRIF